MWKSRLPSHEALQNCLTFVAGVVCMSFLNHQQLGEQPEQRMRQVDRQLPVIMSEVGRIQ